MVYKSIKLSVAHSFIYKSYTYFRESVTFMVKYKVTDNMLIRHDNTVLLMHIKA